MHQALEKKCAIQLCDYADQLTMVLQVRIFELERP